MTTNYHTSISAGVIQLDPVNDALDGIDAGLTSAHSKADANVASISTLDTRVTDTESDITTLQTDVATAQTTAEGAADTATAVDTRLASTEEVSGISATKLAALGEFAITTVYESNFADVDGVAKGTTATFRGWGMVLPPTIRNLTKLTIPMVQLAGFPVTSVQVRVSEDVDGTFGTATTLDTVTVTPTLIDGERVDVEVTLTDTIVNAAGKILYVEWLADSAGRIGYWGRNPAQIYTVANGYPKMRYFPNTVPDLDTSVEVTAEQEAYLTWEAEPYLLTPHPDLLSVTVPSMSNGDDTYNQHHLTLYRAALARLRAGDADTVLSIYGLGDSWYANQGYLPQLVDILAAEGFANVGPGAIYFQRSANGASANSPTPTGHSVVIDAGWDTSEDVAAGANAGYAESTASGDMLSIAVSDVADYWRTTRIDYLARSGGGSFRYRINFGAWTTQSADNGDDQVYASIQLDEGSDGVAVLEIEALSAGVRILGVDIRKSGGGFVIHRGGNGGAKAEDYAALEAASFQDHLEAFEPQLVLVALGTNDQPNRTPSQFAANLETVLSRCKAADAPTEEIGYVVPPDVLYVSPTENISDRTTLIAEYTAELRKHINAGTFPATVAFFDMHLHAGDRTYNRAAGIFEASNELHMSDNGRVWAARLLWNKVLSDQ